MPFEGRGVDEVRREFAELANREGANLAELCRRYGVSRPTGRLWRDRYRAAGAAGLAERSRRPRSSPGRTPDGVEAAVLALRDAHPAWGGRKLHHALRAGGGLDPGAVPAPSTITAILERHGRLRPAEERVRPWRRFEREEPNDLWQMDFMGHRALAAGGRVHPLAVLDDHSRFALVLAACPDRRRETVRPRLEAAFRRHGLPRAILADNGPPWGTSGAGGVTALEAWLLRLGVRLLHGRPYHPQTQGKVERFHGTVAAEVFAGPPPADLAACQRRFDVWRDAYNRERPHQALGFAAPLVRWQPAPRPFPDALPEPVYGPDDHVRVVRDQGAISFRNRSRFVGRGLAGERVAVRPTTDDGVFAVVYCSVRVALFDDRDDGD
jgi:transposase InsO family protein